MALGYLISPALQVEDKDGKPLVGGEIVVFRHGTTTPYITWKNFNGDRNPARVPLNALGMAVLLADDSQLYDVYCYDRNGVQQWSRLNVSATTGVEGGGGEPGSDLSVLRCDAADLTQSGQFVFDTLSRQGEGAYVDAEGHIRLAKGTWHYDITVEVDYSPLEETGDTTNLVLYTTLNRACLDFDLSYAHTGTLQLSGIVNADDGAMLSVGMGGMATGMTVSVADCGIFEVTGTSTSWEYYEAGAGIEIDGNIIAVDPDEVQGKLTAGTGIDITDDVISVTGGFTQEQADWNETDSSAVDYIKNKPDLGVYATDAELTAGLATKQDVISDLSTIRSGAAAGATAVQPGSLATVATSGSYNDLSNKPSIPAALSAGDGISIASDVVSAKVDGTTISVNLDGELVALGTGTDSAFLAQYGTTTYQEIAAAVADNRAVFVTGSANALTAVMPMTSFNTNPAMVLFGTLIGSTEQTVKLDQGVWSCDYVDIQADWSETNQLKPSYIRSKPANLVQDANYVHTDNNFTNADATKLSGIAAGAEVNVQSDWNETDTSSDAYIANKPTIPAAQVNSDWNAVSGVAEILNKPSIPSGADLVPPYTLPADEGKVLTVGPSSAYWDTPKGGSVYYVTYGTTTWEQVQAAYAADNKVSFILLNENGVQISTTFELYDPTSSLGYIRFYQVRDTIPQAGIAITTYRLVFSGTHWSLSTYFVLSNVQADWTEANSSYDSYIKNKPDLSVYAQTSSLATVATTGAYSDLTGTPAIPSGAQLVPAATSADADKVLTVDSQGTPAWSSAQAPISAGNGIDITNNVVSVDTSVVATQTDLAGKEDAFDVGTGLEMDTSGSTPTLQVEAPVDIVAGTGIAIDNPDGNTMRITNTGFPISETDAVRCGTFKGDPMYTKTYTFTGTVGTSETTIGMTIDEKKGTDGVNRIWVDPSNSFIVYGSAGNNFLPLSWRLGSSRQGSVAVLGASTGSLSCRCVDTSSTPITLNITIRYTVSNS